MCKSLTYTKICHIINIISIKNTLMIFIETHIFTEDLLTLLSDDEYSEFLRTRQKFKIAH